MRIVENTETREGTEIADFTAIKNCDIGTNCRIWRFVNMYGATIGDDCMIGSFVEIQRDVIVGSGTRVQTHAFICSLVELGEDVFVSHGAKFINDRYPPSGGPEEWEATHVGDDVTIGTNATILPVEIGDNAMIGAGAVVTEDVPENAIVAGNPAEIVGYRDQE
jgi:acetyltransferase-like isoleucine patch superfamily enzyme